MIRVFERAKTFRALNTTATTIGDKQGPDFVDNFFLCILCDALKYINPGDELLVTEV
jgi:hypothetical protein